MIIKTTLASLLLATLALSAALHQAQASQGCPFDDGSCQVYCNQQNCKMGYCGNFAWISCICRKCGDEWNYYDKVRFNPDQAVNQTELDSLKLNGTSPLILVSNSGSEQQTSGPSTTPTNTLKYMLTSKVVSTGQQEQQVAQNKTTTVKENKPATLTTLLIPDLSDTSKIDLNDIPDENSDKFLDFLAKNHEKLVQATSAESQSNGAKNDGDDTQDDSDSDSESSTTSAPTSTISPTLGLGDEETVEIRISSSNNNLRIGQEQKQHVLVSERSFD